MNQRQDLARWLKRRMQHLQIAKVDLAEYLGYGREGTGALSFLQGHRAIPGDLITGLIEILRMTPEEGDDFRIRCFLARVDDDELTKAMNKVQKRQSELKRRVEALEAKLMITEKR